MANDQDAQREAARELAAKQHETIATRDPQPQGGCGNR
jgi:hypothetical protein